MLGRYSYLAVEAEQRRHAERIRQDTWATAFMIEFARLTDGEPFVDEGGVITDYRDVQRLDPKLAAARHVSALNRRRIATENGASSA